MLLVLNIMLFDLVVDFSYSCVFYVCEIIFIFYCIYIVVWVRKVILKFMLIFFLKYSVYLDLDLCSVLSLVKFIVLILYILLKK